MEQQDRPQGKTDSSIPSGTYVLDTYTTSWDDLDVVIQQSVGRLSQADPHKVQEIAASQIELMAVYHRLVLNQAARSFTWALIAAGIGLAFYLAAVGLVLVQQPQNAAIISLISGSVIEVISGINFYLYGKTSAQLADFQSRLDVTQRYLLANSVCEGLEGESKQRVRTELVRAIAGIGVAKLSSADSPSEEAL
jgi:hypothetical protein